MVFSSNIFLFSFLPLFLAIYYLCPDKYKNWVILGASHAFYARWRIDFLLLFSSEELDNTPATASEVKQRLEQINMARTPIEQEPG